MAASVEFSVLDTSSETSAILKNAEQLSLRVGFAQDGMKGNIINGDPFSNFRTKEVGSSSTSLEALIRKPPGENWKTS